MKYKCKKCGSEKVELLKPKNLLDVISGKLKEKVNYLPAQLTIILVI
ncbi:MAG: hypothetical protein AABW56_04725 [Nanoarchaeota archaeon]